MLPLIKAPAQITFQNGDTPPQFGLPLAALIGIILSLAEHYNYTTHLIQKH